MTSEEVVFLPTHMTSNPRTGKVFTVEMHHQRVELANLADNVSKNANQRDNVGLNIRGLDKNNMLSPGDVMVYIVDSRAARNGLVDASSYTYTAPFCHPTP
eukprot:5072039-Karenia_brevis.AAC.1